MERFLVKQLKRIDDGIGGVEESYQTIYIGSGFLDLMTGTNENNVQNASVEESTHILITEWFEEYNQVIQSNMIVDYSDTRYRITYVDNPTGYDDHLEIYLKYERDISEREIIDDYLEDYFRDIIQEYALKGDTGEQGEPGEDGLDGKSAYDIWLEDNTGTRHDFFNSLKGEQGIQGPKGDPGEQGEQGIQGIEGPRGLKGDQGIQGIQGPQGEVGLKGDQGPEGKQGPKGEDGKTPVKGVDYFDGAKGDKGDRGDPGPKGDKGDTGEQGLRGLQGIQGPEGPQGPEGKQGPQGEQGLLNEVTGTPLKYWMGSQAEYDAIGTYDLETVYDIW